MVEVSRIVGRVISIVRERGFFFVRPDGDMKDYFAHRSDLLATVDAWPKLSCGDWAEFTPDPNAGRPKARDVRVVRSWMPEPRRGVPAGHGGEAA